MNAVFDTTDRIIKSLKEKNIITTRTDISRITYYDVNLEQLNNLLNGIYLVAKRAFTKVPKQQLVIRIIIIQPETTIQRIHRYKKKNLKKKIRKLFKKALRRGLEISLLTALALTNIIQI